VVIVIVAELITVQLLLSLDTAAVNRLPWRASLTQYGVLAAGPPA